jgi:ribosomal protein S18 acetylase RimI-like enzyme
LPNINFTLDTADVLNISDNEISALLTQVYVDGGFTSPDEAITLFDPSAVRQRGILIGARDMQQAQFAGMVIVVPPASSARRFAGDNEAEMHLLGVKPEYRRHGLGRRLIEAAVEMATRLGYAKLILWTQNSMHSAQHLYEAAGFTHTGNFERNGRGFKIYERKLIA